MVIKAFVKKHNNKLLEACKQRGVFNVRPNIIAVYCFEI